MYFTDDAYIMFRDVPIKFLWPESQSKSFNVGYLPTPSSFFLKDTAAQCTLRLQPEDKVR